MSKLVDEPDLGSGAARREGSSPSIRTMKETPIKILACVLALLGLAIFWKDGTTNMIYMCQRNPLHIIGLVVVMAIGATGGIYIAKKIFK